MHARNMGRAPALSRRTDWGGTLKEIIGEGVPNAGANGPVCKKKGYYGSFFKSGSLKKIIGEGVPNADADGPVCKEKAALPNKIIMKRKRKEHCADMHSSEDPIYDGGYYKKSMETQGASIRRIDVKRQQRNKSMPDMEGLNIGREKVVKNAKAAKVARVKKLKRLTADVFKGSCNTVGGQIEQGGEVLKTQLEKYGKLANINCRVRTFGRIVQSFDLQKRQWVTDMGFGSLLNLENRMLPNNLCYWLLTRLDTVRKVLVAGGIEFSLSKNQVHWVLGIPIGPNKVPRKIQNLEMKRLVHEIALKYGIRTPSNSCNISMRLVMEKIKSPYLPEDEQDFKTAFLILALGLVLCPTTSWYLGTDLMPAATLAKDASTYDWSEFVLQKLLESGHSFAEKFYKHGFAKGSGGCTYFLAIFYLDQLNRLPLKWNEFPRIKVWIKSDVHQAETEDRIVINQHSEDSDKKVLGDYGRLGCLNVAYGKRHPVEHMGHFSVVIKGRRKRSVRIHRTPYQHNLDKEKCNADAAKYNLLNEGIQDVPNSEQTIVNDVFHSHYQAPSRTVDAVVTRSSDFLNPMDGVDGGVSVVGADSVQNAKESVDRVITLFAVVHVDTIDAENNFTRLHGSSSTKYSRGCDQFEEIMPVSEGINKSEGNILKGGGLNIQDGQGMMPENDPCTSYFQNALLPENLPEHDDIIPEDAEGQYEGDVGDIHVLQLQDEREKGGKNLMDEDKIKEVKRSNMNMNKDSKSSGGPETNTICCALVEDKHGQATQQMNTSIDDDLVIVSDSEDDACDHFEAICLKFETKIAEVEKQVSAMKAAKLRSRGL